MNNMKLEVFKYLLATMRDSSTKSLTAYKLGIDLVNFEEAYQQSIDLLMECYWGKEGNEWISWFVYEKNGDKLMKAWDKNKKEICRTEEECWELAEECRKKKRKKNTNSPNI